MADDQPPPGRRDPGPMSGAHLAWSTLGYLVAGVGVWGLVGALVDRWLGLDGVATGVGVLVGAAGGIYLVIRRSGI